MFEPWILSLGTAVATAYKKAIEYARAGRAAGVVPDNHGLALFIRPHLNGLDPHVHGAAIVKDAERDQLAALLAGIVLNVIEAEQQPEPGSHLTGRKP